VFLCLQVYMGCVQVYMGCVQVYMGCVQVYMGCVQVYMGCVNFVFVYTGCYVRLLDHSGNSLYYF